MSLADTWSRKVQVIGEDNKSEPQEAVTLSRVITSDRYLLNSKLWLEQAFRPAAMNWRSDNE